MKNEKDMCHFCGGGLTDPPLVAILKNGNMVRVCSSCLEKYRNEIKTVITYLNGEFVEYKVTKP